MINDQKVSNLFQLGKIFLKMVIKFLRELKYMVFVRKF